ncbi:MAG: CTAG/PCC1 family protein [Thaumarchaeota archaeon]|nr:CTAG/PCC1 family protein [Nitrososphaerota archaeon]
MSLECRVQVFLNNITERKAEAVRKALEPDNVDFPEGLSFRIEGTGRDLVLTFEGKGNIRTLISTIDEVLEHTNLVLKVTEDA